MLPLTDITKFTFQDYPDCTACIIWFAGCNFRCPYCHNPEFISTKNHNFLSEKEVFDFLKSRKQLIEGVVLSGGEVTLHDIYNFVGEIKKMGFLLKIDTNGTNPDLLKKLFNEKLIDFVALDYKAPEDKFFSITKNKDFYKFNETLEFLIKSKIQMEIRTTVHTNLLQENDINKIIKHLESLEYKGIYAIQNFKNTKTLENIGEQKEILKQNFKSDLLKIIYRNF